MASRNVYGTHCLERSRCCQEDYQMIKWIGQHIWDFISRFRNDVYLESVVDGTVHEDKFLGLDSTGKIVKETVSGGVQLVSVKNDDLYLTWVGVQNSWYSFGFHGAPLALTGSEEDSNAINSCSFIATRACVVTKVTISFYISASCDLEFYFGKVPLVNNSTSNVTIVEITSTDHDGSYTANTNYVKSFDLSGANASLTTGQGLAIFARRTDATGTSLIYGNAFAEISLS